MEFILLEDCCEILDSLRIPITASDREKGIYPYYGANGIQDYVSSYIFDDDLVLLAEDGGSFGSKTKPIAYRVSGKCWVNNHAHVLKPKEGMDVDFLCYSLMFYNTEGLVNGATRQKLTQSAVRKMKIPKLNIDVQRNIVKEIKYVKSIIAIRGKQLEKLSLLVRARFVEMFGDPISNPYELPVVKLGELSELITKGASPSWQGFSYTDDSSQTLFVTSENVREGFFDLSSPKYIEDGFNDKQKRSMIHKGDFLINIVGASIGRAAQFNLECKANMNQASALVRINDNRIIDKYLLVYLNSDKAQRMYDYMKSDTGRANLSLQDINDLTIMLPPLDKQIEYETFVQQVDKSKLITYYHHKSIYTKPQLCCKMVIVNDFLNTKRF